jgi:hypothetical protein
MRIYSAVPVDLAQFKSGSADEYEAIPLITFP